MASRTDITGERLIESLTWEWQDVEDLRQQLIPTVAPGKALRTYQSRASRNKGTGNRRPFTQDEQIASGARSIVNDRINSLEASGRIEFSEDRTMVRFRDRRQIPVRDGLCPTCNRPFSKPTREKTATPPPQSAVGKTVVYPDFPSWREHEKTWGAQ